jgi:hypothetical protein
MIKLEWVAEKVSMAGFHLTEWPAVTPSSFVLVYFEPGTWYLAASSAGQARVSKGAAEETYCLRCVQTML